MATDQQIEAARNLVRGALFAADNANAHGEECVLRMAAALEAPAVAVGTGGLQAAMSQLYAAEINCGMSSFWDGGWAVWIGDDMNGRRAEEQFWAADLNKVADWLLSEAEAQFPAFKRLPVPCDDLTRAEEFEAALLKVRALCPATDPGPARDPVWGDWNSNGNQDDVAWDNRAEGLWEVAVIIDAALSPLEASVSTPSQMGGN